MLGQRLRRFGLGVVRGVVRHENLGWLPRGNTAPGQQEALPGWPLHGAAAQEMEVDVPHRLDAVRTGVDEHPEPAVRDPLVPGDAHGVLSVQRHDVAAHSSSALCSPIDE